jgi:very-short-patch-repair endonuclease
MRILFHLTALLVLIGILKLLYSSKEFQNWLKSQRASFSYKRQPALFSPAERSFLGVLEQVLGSDYRVFGKVRIADLITPQNGAGRQTALNLIVGKHVDFVVCNAKNLSIIGVIELDDKSHNEDRRQIRDAFVDMAFASARIPIIRFPARAAYSLAAIRESIQRSFDLVLNEKVKASPPLKLVVPVKVTPLCDFNDQNGPDIPEN